MKKFNMIYERIMKSINENNEFDGFERADNPKKVKDIYFDKKLQSDAWEFCQEWPEEILAGLTGETSTGKTVSQQNIHSMLSQVEDLGKYDMDEWDLFFQNVRLNGI